MINIFPLFPLVQQTIIWKDTIFLYIVSRKYPYPSHEKVGKYSDGVEGQAKIFEGNYGV